MASIGNFFDYVPIRTFTLESDMGSVRRGFGWSAWPILLLFGVPTLIAMVWLFWRVMPRTLAKILPGHPYRQLTVAIVTVGVLFGFYGAAGLLEGGSISYALSQASIFAALPIALATVFTIWLKKYSLASTASPQIDSVLGTT